MKKTWLFVSLIALSFGSSAQNSKKFSYQAIVRDASNHLIAAQLVSTKISILKGNAAGPASYVEIHQTSTNANGLLSLEIGSGAVQSGSLAAIDWTSDPYFIMTETDPTGGTNYTLTTVSQILSVPHALQATIADSARTLTTQGNAVGEMLYWNGAEWVTVQVPTDYYEAKLTMKPGGIPTWEGGYPEPPSGYYYAFSPTGKIWLDRNLGAAQVATASNDLQAYGDLYQWGRAADGHQLRNSETTNTLSASNNPGHAKFILGSSPRYNWMEGWPSNLWQASTGINNPCPAGFRVPTVAEFAEELETWTSKNAAGAIGSALKLPLAGYRNYSNGSVAGGGTQGGYWTSTSKLIANGSNYDPRACLFSFSNTSATANENNYTYRTYGYSVRCIKE